MQLTSQRIFTAALTVGSLNGVVMLFAVLRDLIFAYRFGTGEIVDAFLIGLLVPTMTVQIVAVSLSLALVPEIIHAKGRGDQIEARQLASSASVLALGLLCVIVVFLLIFHGSVISILTSGFDERRSELTDFFYLGTLPCIIIQGWSTLVGSFLNASRRFAVVAIAPVLRPVAICTILQFPWQQPNYASLVLAAYLFGAVAEAAWLTIAAYRAGTLGKLRWFGLTANFRKILSEFGMAVVGTGILSGAILANQYFASLTPAGGVAAYGYGAKITSVLIGAAALPLGAAVLPHFSEQVRELRWVEFRTVLLQWTAIIFAFSVPAVVLLWIYSVELVQLLFLRGAFSEEDAKRVAEIQRYLAVQIPFYLCGILYVRALISLQRNGLVAAVAVVNAAINIGGSILLLNDYGVGGIALSVTGAYAVATGLAGWCVFYLLKRMSRQELHHTNGLTDVSTAQNRSG